MKTVAIGVALAAFFILCVVAVFNAPSFYP